MKTPLTERLGLMHPVIQAPLAGGGDTAELVAAVCNAGGLGFIGAAYLTPDQIIARTRAVRALTSRPFGINLFAPQPAAELPANAGDAVSRITPYHAELGIDPPELPGVQPDPFSVQLEAVLETEAAVFSFTLGLIPPASLRAVKQRMYVIGTATTVEEAVASRTPVWTRSSRRGARRAAIAEPFCIRRAEA